MSALPDEGKSAAASRLVGSQLTTLYEQYYTDVYAYCRRRLRNREEAEDATQVTFVKAFAAFRRGIVPDTEAAWLFTIAKRVVLTRLGVTNRLRAVETVTELDHFEAPDAADLAEFHELQRAIEALPETSRRAFVMREWQGLQYEEIADELGLQRSHVGVILLRARRQVVKQLRTALSFGPAPAFLRRGLEMLSTEGAHIAAASAIAASAPVLVVVAPMSGSASAATTTHASMTSVAAASSGHTSPLGSRFAQHVVAAGGSRRAIAAPAATSIIARISLPAAPTPSVAATAPVDPVDPADSVGIVDPVVPTPVEPQPQEPARTIASDPGPMDAAPAEPFDAEPTIGAPTEETSDGPADVPAEPAAHSEE